MKRIVVALVSVALLVCGCAAGSGGGDVSLARANVSRAGTAPGDAISAAAAVDAFGVELLRAAASPDRNAVVSPASIVLALAMARAGARGDTAAEMDAVLHDAASDEHAAWLNALDAALATRSGTFEDQAGSSRPVTLRIANAAFGQRGLTFVPAYLDALASRFGAGVRLVDYVANADAARRAINAWVADRTEQRIRDLLDPSVVTRDTRLVLANAIYLKAAWLTPFEPAATRPAPFTRADGSTVEVPTMSTVADLRYAEGDGWRAVELPYVGGQLALDVIAPDDLARFEASLGGTRLADLGAALAPRQVTLGLPKFGLETKVDLASTLAAMGMPTAFTDRADFSGITTDEPLEISAVVHQANIDVDEKGTEAAAATAVVIRDTAAPAEPVVLNVDRPFLFALRDLGTGAILFLGHVADPLAGGD